MDSSLIGGWTLSFSQSLPEVMMIELENFLNQGGPVLVVIMGTTFGLIYLVLERAHFFWRLAPRERQRVIDNWNRRPDHASWFAHQIRRCAISVVRLRSEKNLLIIKTAIVIAPLLGLLGTVTGMIDVFDAMAYSGSGNTRAMAAGVSKATIPTMAGMVVALVGMLCVARLQRSFDDNIEWVSTQLTLGDPVDERRQSDG
ncbi:MotA/TolQ/ExbB proton channel family protein [Aurantivibrio plasticivorans]